MTLDAQDYSLAALGHVAELHDIGLRLFALLRKAPGVTLHCPERVASVSRTQQQVNVTLENGNVIAGSVLVAANGTHSALASACGVDWRQEPYEQLAVIANVATAIPHQDAPLNVLPQWPAGDVADVAWPMFAGLVSPARPAR